MASPAWRRLVSIAVAGLGAAGAWAFLSLPGAAPPPLDRAAPPLEHRPAEGFHRLLRAAPPPAAPGPCVGCHGGAPHRRTPVTRAFLNLHPRALACGVCHLAGRDLAVRGTPTDPSRLTAVRRVGLEWAVLDGPGPGIRLRPVGPECAECHRRGSAFFAGLDRYDPYRRRLLEDLAVLPQLRGVRR